MLSASEIPHPNQPPSWLDAWPSAEQLEAQFPSGLRRMAIILTTKLTEASLEWTDTVIRARMNGQMCTWRHDGSQWVKRCTCGAPATQCPHVYMTCLLLQRIFVDEHWIQYRSPAASASSRPEVRTPSRPSVPMRSQQTLPGFGRPQDTRRVGGGGFFNEDAPSGNLRHNLEVEADFKHEPPKVTMRFYDRELGERTLMPISALYNLSYRISQNNITLPDWPQQDQEFMKWLFPSISRIPWQMRKLSVLKLDRSTFIQWQSRWMNNPARFIERDSQAVIPYNDLSEPVGFTVELSPEGDFVKLLACFVLEGGSSLPVHEYFSRIENTPEHDTLLKRLKTYKPPIPWPVLEQHFSQKPPRMKRELVAGHLKDLLNGHLEIVSGSCVSVKHSSPERLEYYAGMAENQFFLSLLQDGSPVELQGQLNLKSSIHDNGRHFTIVLPDTEVLAAPREALKSLPYPAQCTGSRIMIPGGPQGARFLKNIWKDLPKDIRKNCSPKLQLLLQDQQDGRKNVLTPVVTMHENGPLSQISLEWSCQKMLLSMDDVKAAATEKQSFFQTPLGSWLEISPEAARKALDALATLPQDADGTLLTRHAGAAIQSLVDTCNAELDNTAEAFMKRLADAPPLTLPAVSPELETILRPYQRDGITFLLDRAACGVGSILADDMGLGKTLQVLAALDAWRRQDLARATPFRALIICPASVMRTWQQQARQFCPALSTAVLHGSPSQRARQLETSSAHVLITHYQLARIDKDILQTLHFDFLVLDEAQAVKNPDAQVTRVVSSLDAAHAIAMTGTPLENTVMDLWSIMNCINPGFLGDRDSFASLYSTTDIMGRLKRKIRPLVLRRTKSMVCTELPPKTEQVIMLEMTQEQRDVYDRTLMAGKENLNEKGPDAILGLLTRLREACCHPGLVDPRFKQGPSVKLERLVEQLVTLNGSGHSTLVFSQFTSMLDIIARELEKQGLPYSMITGDTPLSKRQKLVDDFVSSSAPSTFLLSIKAAGTGLTLTKADYVFLFDPWWNPAVEQQAIDRTHRIGQTNPVFAYKFITANTVEEKVMDLLREKRALFSAVLGDSDAPDDSAIPGRLTREDLRALLD